MIVKIKDKEYSFDGYTTTINSVQRLAEDVYQQGRADAIEEVDKFMKNFPSLLSHLTVMEEWENFKEQLKDKKL